MKIDFVNLRVQYSQYKEEIDSAVLKVFSSCQFIQGDEVSKLEEELVGYVRAKHCISCSSGTDALLLALMSIDIQPGDEVITTPFTFIATAEVISLLKAKPVFVDIDESTYNIDPSRIEEKINSRTRAIMPVCLYGQPADMDDINEIAGRHNLIVIEDAAQSFGAEYKGRRSCNLSHIGCTSFFPSKPLGCYGDGGAIFTNDEKMADKIRSMMNHGQARRYEHQYIGINGRLDALQAAILRVKLGHLDDEVQRRVYLGKRYTELLNRKEVVTPTVKDDRTSVYAQYSIRVNDRERVIQRLNEAGIPTAIHYPIPVYRQEALGYLNINPDEYPVTEEVSRHIMSLPMSAFLTEEEQDYIVRYI